MPDHVSRISTGGDVAERYDAAHRVDDVAVGDAHQRAVLCLDTAVPAVVAQPVVDEVAGGRVAAVQTMELLEIVVTEASRERPARVASSAVALT